MLQELRFAIRMLIKRPGFSLIAALTLALGIGATSAVFSLIQGVLLTPPPYQKPEQLMLIPTVRADGQKMDSPRGWAAQQWMGWQKEAKSFDGIAAYNWTFNFLIRNDGSQSMQGMQVTKDYVQVMGLRPMAGRSFENSDFGQGPVKAILRRIPRSEAMAEMKAMEFTDELHLQPVRRPIPEPQAGEILIQVFAAGVTPTEKLWYPTSHYADGTARSKAIPGHEFSGTVAGLGAGATSYSLGDTVFGLNDWFAEGATAEFCITKPSNLSLKPSSLSHIEAASAPIGLLTAWQGLHLRAKLQKGERVLIHGGAGAVGLFAVQLANSQGAYVIATSSKANVDFVGQLGANEVIDYRERRFEEAGLVDVIFDTVGGETLDRSWDLLKPGGRLVTIAADAESSTDPRVKSAFFIVEQDGEQLAALGKLFDSGELKAFVKAELPMEEADHAYSGSIAGNPGKLIIRTKEFRPALGRF